MPGLLEVLCGPDELLAEQAERVLVRAGATAFAAAAARLSSAVAPARGRLARLLGRIAATSGEAAHAEAVLALLADPDPKVRRNAVIALGKLRHPEAEAALWAYWDRDPGLAHRRSLATALGKCGGALSQQRLAAVRSDDPELARCVARALLSLERTLNRGATAEVALDAVPAAPLPLELACRGGLERLVVEALPAELAPRVVAPGVVAVQLTGPLSRPWACRLVSALAFPLPPVRGSLEAAFIDSLCSPAAAAILGCFTRGAVRYRIAWAGGGHRRAVVWRLAQAVAARAPQLRNDPTGSNWEVRVTEHADGTVQLRLVPRFADTRFAYRVRDVPAASHPTLAAALALVAGVRADDVVWDPFVGSGTELIERARLGPCAALIGTDSDPRALAAAGVNLAAAGLVASLSGGDACSQPVTGVTLILCNPPMGRRVHRGDVAPLLERFLAHAARRLRPGGRLVWISPLPGRTLHWARRAGLVASYRQPVDMGGFSAEIQRFDRPERG